MDYLILFFTGVLATTIGTLAGSGGLISLPTMLILGIPIHSAIGANKVSNTVSSFTSFYAIFKRQNMRFRDVWWIIPFSLAGGFTGGFLASLMKSEALSYVAIALLIFAFATSFLNKKGFESDEPLRLSKWSGAGLYSIGIYDGVFGPGQGTLMMYLFSYLRVSYIRSVGLVRLATFSSCFGAAISYISSGVIIWPLTLALMAGSITGAQVGVRLAEKLKPSVVKPILRVVTALLIVQIIMETI